MALSSAFATLLERHPALRTTYATRDGVPYQRIGPPTDFVLEMQDAGGWDQQTLADRLDANAYRPFDLEHGPILRATLFTCGISSAVLLIAVHHIAADFWSLETMATELGQLYEAAVAGRPCELPACAGILRDVRDMAGGAPRRGEGRGAPSLLVQRAVRRANGPGHPHRQAAPGVAVLPRRLGPVRRAR